MKRIRGFTLVESIIAMVIMGIAMVTIASFLLPQVLRSADPYYQTRATELGQSVMAQMLSRGFADNSDFDGGDTRCGDDNGVCTVPLGADDGESEPNDFNDVDDYIGCWVPSGSSECGDLNLLTKDNGENSYQNFRVEISVSADSNFDAQTMKRIDLAIITPNQPTINLRAFRGNY
ncbi:MSHA pilin protein MshD [Vibrio xiamenensis]|uniref:MSHA pilin protein MshD n=1 Tax=Vibrio xiamenensis TaxID=861298 RepID=A0A1G8BSQ2_9VIBR|nr:prepilin-type N-terminal cleavage/methylation domain-containing protein [Vibrio xiamenensis]SDH36128.1 MSHA pilin protein MshD [Vibrio xiamenensis]